MDSVSRDCGAGAMEGVGHPGPGARPLAGVRVVTTRGASGGGRLRALLTAAGARVLAWPTSEYPPPGDAGPLEAALARLDRFDWVVCTSARSVAAMGGEGSDLAAGAAGKWAGETAGDPPSRSAGVPTSETGRPVPEATGTVGERDIRSAARPGGPARATRPPPSPRVAVVGPTTARAATEAGWVVAVEGRGPGAGGLAAQVGAAFPLAGARVLYPAASGAASTVEDEFTALGARVTRVEAYQTVVTPPPTGRVRADLAAGVDAVTFASPSAVRAVDRALGGAGERAPGEADGGRGGQATTRGVADRRDAGSDGPLEAEVDASARLSHADGRGRGPGGRLEAGADALERASQTAGRDRALGGPLEAEADAPARLAQAAGRDRTAGGCADPAAAGGLARALTGVAVVCIGPTTAAALERRGVAGVRVAPTATLAGMVDALVELFGGGGGGRSNAGADAGEPAGVRGAGREDASPGGAASRTVARAASTTPRRSRFPGGFLRGVGAVGARPLNRVRSRTVVPSGEAGPLDVSPGRAPSRAAVMVRPEAGRPSTDPLGAAPAPRGRP